ncbi:Serine/threonine-protein kinase PknB [Rubripirellula lacrimiformis]|uniref:Serine/threonine-protein kinase PknB n=1 Tax=Rubripirellula lacrimiformis TaxID=1930273 RepID=A0A517NF14_9BACT|nr:serine/threonine-protein kinase [Rubripirellula lacrimiformis]QDT05722.1 Serine/threonine-protein kinase PknB [Rubripirellula lacrimiformis]
MAIGQERDIFADAVEIESLQQRSEFVASACGGDERLHAVVVDLLREHDRTDSPVDRPVLPGLVPTIIGIETGETDARHKIGTVVGPYKLMEKIGEGGFGLVFVADQQKPVRRRVALKIIKPGMETREVIARFEAERQAIAMMDHENIARVFDAGVTDAGQPYFVMELVRGVPLNEFCDNHRLDTQARLALFVSICNAVQHAHQKGIIHRDLKPSNVLVTLQDGRPIAKVIDFGIVKAIGGQSLTDKTIYTRLASMIGTPAYMSPEQAEMSNVDVDTRSDIYSLGVMLYELLAGSTPFTRERLNSVGFDELRQIIREEEPPRPSARFSTLGSKLATTVSAKRRLEPAKLTSLMKGDLDWIAMKALDKDRARRYPSAVAMAEDVQRFLMREPVEARPPSAAYRFSRFARRNKVALFTFGSVAAALLIGSVVSLWQARVAIDALQQARTAEAEATQSRDELELFTDRLKRANQLLTSGRAYAESGDWANAHDDYLTATRTQPRYFHVWMERGSLYGRLGLWDRAVADYTKALELGAPVNGAEFIGVPQLFLYTGNAAEQQRLSDDLFNSGDGGSWGTTLRGQLIGKTSKQDAALLARRAEKLVGSESVPPLERTRFRSRMPFGAKLYIAGWAHLKAGQFQQAVNRLEQGYEEDLNWGGHGIEFPLLAMAYHQMGESEKAIAALDQSKDQLDRWIEESLAKLQGTPPMPWFDWVEFLINHNEASLMVSGQIPDPDPRFAELKRLATEAIQ